jgi:hypothetical protein
VVETRWSGGKVKHEHVASLGSIPHEPSMPERIAFWQRLHERHARLANRIDAKARAKILAAVRAKVPMVTPAGQRDLQLTNAQGDERVWSSRRASLASCQACGHVLPRGASAFVERKWNR